MSATLISRSPDLARLEAAGFRLRIIQGTANHLLIEGIPAVNARREVVLGTLYCPLELDPSGRAANPVGSHQCWWIGAEAPCDATGRVMTEMISSNGVENKGDALTTLVAFSRIRPDRSKYPNYYEKIRTYVNLIWQQAVLIDPKCNPCSDRPVAAVVQAQEQVFHYPDMATTRSGIGAATAKLISQRIGIIGVGGSGAYILDLVAKAPVREIHLFDGDVFELHNAFRAPGAPTAADLEAKPKKVDWFYGIYSRMHKRIIPHPYHVGEAQLAELAGLDFVFVAVDDPEARKIIHRGLVALSIPFTDTGMGLDLDRTTSLRGQLRVTTATPQYHDHLEQAVSYAAGPENDVYRNIQVADLNMNAASHCVMRWKRYLGFYADDAHEHQSLYRIATNGLVKGDCQ